MTYPYEGADGRLYQVPQFPGQQPGQAYPGAQYTPTQAYAGEVYRPAAVVVPATGRWTVKPGPYISGVAATALVGALVALIGELIAGGLLKLDTVPPRMFGLTNHTHRSIAAAVVAAIVLGILLWVLILTSPQARTFFSWIAGLLTVVATLLPFTTTDVLRDALATAVINAVAGVSILVLLNGVAGRTMIPRAPEPAPER